MALVLLAASWSRRAPQVRRGVVVSAPTFQQMRQEALRLLGDALDVLRSDWDEEHGPTSAQGLALDEALHHIGRAKAHLDRAAR